jgi:hypothetical protein
MLNLMNETPSTAGDMITNGVFLGFGMAVGAVMVGLFVAACGLTGAVILGIRARAAKKAPMASRAAGR